MQKLKSLVLSIDWEITESCLTELIEETDVLLPQHENDRYAHTLLRMLRAVSGYIRKHKVESHPDAIKRIMSAFSSLENLTGVELVDEDHKKRVVAKEIAAFKKLKAQVDVKHGVVPDHHQDGEKASATGSGDYIDCHQFEQAINEVEARLDSQVSGLKAQMAVLQKELDSLRTS